MKFIAFLSLTLLSSLITYTHASSKCRDSYPYALDVGIYWAGESESGSGTEIVLEKSCATAFRSDEEFYLSKYFNPRRKTLIFVHGAQPHAVELGYDRTGMGVDWAVLVTPWVKLGWNVGFFHWTQFADEPIRTFERAQAKIWDTRYFRGMEYTYAPKSNPNDVQVGKASVKRDVTEILVDELLAHEIIGDTRIVGHSLGGQLAVRAMHYLRLSNTSQANERRRYIPKEATSMFTRVELLDPVYSSLPQGFLVSHRYGMLIPDVIGHYAADLEKDGVTLATYPSSPINECLKSSGVDTLLMKSAAVAHPIFNQWGEAEELDCFGKELWGDPKHLLRNANDMAMQVANQHIAVVKFYMLSIVYPPMRCHLKRVSEDQNICIRENSLSISAAMPTEQLFGWHSITDPITGEKLCLIEYDDGNRNPDGATMTFIPTNKLFHPIPCAQLRI